YESELFYSVGHLHLEGLTLELSGDDRELQGRSLVRVREGTLIVSGCHLAADSGGCCIVCEFSDDLTIHDSDLISEMETTVAAILDERDEVTIEDSLIAGAVGFEVDVRAPCEIELKGCTFLALNSITIFHHGGDDSLLAVDAEHNFFESDDGVIHFPSLSLSADNFRKYLQWIGRENIYRGDMIAIGEDAEGRPTWCQNYDDWVKLVTESNSEQPATSLSLLQAELP
ncbi:MAG: hypothetical protein MI861_01090, partial [Pirellulales bacterium]|nr:hypothetical protein [Pirellulales bacterium]